MGEHGGGMHPPLSGGAPIAAAVMPQGSMGWKWRGFIVGWFWGGLSEMVIRRVDIVISHSKCNFDRRDT